MGSLTQRLTKLENEAPRPAGIGADTPFRSGCWIEALVEETNRTSPEVLKLINDTRTPEDYDSGFNNWPEGKALFGDVYPTADFLTRPRPDPETKRLGDAAKADLDARIKANYQARVTERSIGKIVARILEGKEQQSTADVTAIEQQEQRIETN